MPSHIVKRAPDVDEYLIFSTIVDHPVTFVLTRDEMLGLHEVDEERLTRADENGSSAQWGWPENDPLYVAFGWADTTFVMTNCNNLPETDDGCVEMTRDEVFEHTKADLTKLSADPEGADE